MTTENKVVMRPAMPADWQSGLAIAVLNLIPWLAMFYPELKRACRWTALPFSIERNIHVTRLCPLPNGMPWEDGHRYAMLPDSAWEQFQQPVPVSGGERFEEELERTCMNFLMETGHQVTRVYLGRRQVVQMDRNMREWLIYASREEQQQLYRGGNRTWRGRELVPVESDDFIQLCSSKAISPIDESSL